MVKFSPFAILLLLGVTSAETLDDPSEFEEQGDRVLAVEEQEDHDLALEIEAWQSALGMVEEPANNEVQRSLSSGNERSQLRGQRGNVQGQRRPEERARNPNTYSSSYRANMSGAKVPAHERFDPFAAIPPNFGIPENFDPLAYVPPNFGIPENFDPLAYVPPNFGIPENFDPFAYVPPGSPFAPRGYCCQ